MFANYVAFGTRTSSAQQAKNKKTGLLLPVVVLGAKARNGETSIFNIRQERSGLPMLSKDKVVAMKRLPVK